MAALHENGTIWGVSLGKRSFRLAAFLVVQFSRLEDWNTRAFTCPVCEAVDRQ